MCTPEEEIELSKRIQEGDTSAINRLVEANLRFVISVAKQYQGKGLPLVDLIEIGTEGALQAARKYNGTKGFKFISYAVWWIRQAIMKAISDQCRTVRIPMSQISCVNKINKITEKFEQLNGRKPSITELEEDLNIDSSKISLALSTTNRSVSLESPIKEEEASCLLDIVPDENSIPVDEHIERKDLSKEIEKILSKLSYRDRDIIRMSFGIGMQAMPNIEIAKRFGIGGERVRQIQHKVLKKIRTNYGNILKELL